MVFRALMLALLLALIVTTVVAKPIYVVTSNDDIQTQRINLQRRQSLCLLVTLTWESKSILQFMFDSFLESEREAVL